ncbi:MAG: cytochrome c peroxidase [Betaproteobacteria bacterium]|jgi:cytochrome c peroxidase|nr:cytochrome c peroxidase [Betaproteobacteria bacterium]
MPTRFARLAVGVTCAMVAWTSLADDRTAGAPTFTESEIQIILSHGPWPMPATQDKTNRVSGKPEAIEFGTRLFFDARLSRVGDTSCATCHVPERNWTDNQRRAIGRVVVDRNTPTVSNLSGSRWYGWDGGADSLWSQSLRPMLDERELGATPKHVADLIRGDEQLACRYRRTFGETPPAKNDEAIFVNIGKTIAAFLETLVSGRTPFDQFRDALARGQPPLSGTYSDAAQRGLKLFIGKGGCMNCHSGPNFTSGEFFSTGLSRFAPNGKPDAGRIEGVRKLLASRFNLLSAYNDDASGELAKQTHQLVVDKKTTGEFKVPSLRNLVLTEPYGRDGSIDRLHDVVRHYSELDPLRLHAKDGKPGTPLKLNAAEQRDLVVFLESLSTYNNGWRPDDGGPCR